MTFSSRSFRSADDDAVRLSPGGEVVPVRHAVDLEQIHVVGPQPFEALLEAAEGAVTGAIAGLGREEHLAAPTGEDPAVIGLRLAVVVRRGGVEIGDAQVQRLLGECTRVVIPRRRKLHADHASERQDAHLHARPAKGAPGHALRVADRAAGVESQPGYREGSHRSDELASLHDPVLRST